MTNKQNKSNVCHSDHFIKNALMLIISETTNQLLLYTLTLYEMTSINYNRIIYQEVIKNKYTSVLIPTANVHERALSSLTSLNVKDSVNLD